MKLCLCCRVVHDAMFTECPQCGWRPAYLDGVEAFAPALADGGGGFEAHFFSELAKLEEGNFWFCARNRLILWALHTYASGFESLLEIGCGTGFVLSGISREFPGRALYGSEIFTAGLSFAATRVPGAKLMQMDAREIPFVSEFDVIAAFDVLEHIDNDVLALDQIYGALKPSGIAILTVPQHQWLWSAVDEYSCHERRYAASELARKVCDAGFRVLRTTSFVSILLPAMMLSRVLQRKKSGAFDAAAELKIGKTMNALFERLLNMELIGIKAGLSYPVGGSRLLVAQKS